ncbi:WD40 repeat-like protein [Russula earlei]|uniref:WD40 repeat-like protein n=1 Tax=Russula earlei TaxID=71964 RepID=A0ACC0U6P2_9AGAM|nr:WD40 repeat-like protein [Russula earlei]
MSVAPHADLHRVTVHMTDHILGSLRDCKLETPLRKRRSRISITNQFSAKRQRISEAIGSIDVSAGAEQRQELADINAEPRADRFIATRPEALFPMNTTPRTNRMAKTFGLTDDRLLHFIDTTNTTPDNKMLASLRRSVSQLFYSPPVVHQTSAVAHLGKRRQFILALDGPGIPQDPWAYPLSWSSTNVIAVACGHDVYYQDLDTRQIAHLCNLPRPSLGRIRALMFEPRGLHAVLGTTTGSVQVWDAASRRRVRSWPNTDWMSISTLAWRSCSRLIAIGKADGCIALLDVRASDEAHKRRGHRGGVHATQWSHDERFLVSADAHGTIHLWDARNMSTRVGKMKHDSPVKAVAWCPWKPDLLATGGTYPDGRIHIWSTSQLANTLSPAPVETIQTHSSVYSLQWSPHSRELLSTHGFAWHTRDRLPDVPETAASPYTNSISVHAFPTCRRLVSVTAHTGTVSQSCLGPDGTMVFTICYREEAMKMWKVWGQREEAERRESSFDKFSIR